MVEPAAIPAPAEPAAADIRHATGQYLATAPRRPRCTWHSLRPDADSGLRAYACARRHLPARAGPVPRRHCHHRRRHHGPAYLARPPARAVLASYDQEAPTYDDHGYPNQTQQDWVARLLRACPAAAKILDAPAGQAGTSRWWPRPGTASSAPTNRRCWPRPGHAASRSPLTWSVSRNCRMWRVRRRRDHLCDGKRPARRLAAGAGEPTSRDMLGRLV